MPCTHTHTHTHTYMCTHSILQSHTLHTYTYICPPTPTYIHPYTSICTTRAHTHTHTHTHAHTHTHTRVRAHTHNDQIIFFILIGLSMLATCPNVVVKVSGLWMFGSAEKSQTLSEFADVARTVVSVFGAHRYVFVYTICNKVHGL